MTQQTGQFEALPPSQQKMLLRCLGFVAVVGWIFIAGALYYKYQLDQYVRETVLDRAKVLSVEAQTFRGSEEGSDASFIPTFRFQTPEGLTQTVTTDRSQSDWGFREGQWIDIRYHMDEPGGAVPWGYEYQWLGLPVFAVIAISIGTLSAFLGTVGWISAKRIQRQS